MSLIDKAGRRLDRAKEGSLIEQAAARGFGKPAREAAPGAPAPGGAGAATLEAPRVPQPSAPQPASPHAPQSAAQPSRPVGPPVARHSAEISIDLDQLASHGFITPTSQSTRLAEEIRLIKHRLVQRMELFSRPGAPDGAPLDRVIMITSARPAEGKSFLSLNLAMSLIADEGLNVLLIDADVVHRSLAKHLGVEGRRGLVEVLQDPGLELSEVLLRDPRLRLTLLPSGAAVASASELFAGPRMQEFTEAVARRYQDRIIVIDTPPVLASTEPLAIAPHVGQILFVIEANKTPERTTRAALDLLEPCENVSLVLNKTTIDSTEEQFGTYYDAYRGAESQSRES